MRNDEDSVQVEEVRGDPFLAASHRKEAEVEVEESRREE